jgi:hypothetical protein
MWKPDRCHPYSQSQHLLLVIDTIFSSFVSCGRVNYKTAMYTSAIQPGGLVEIIKTGTVICMLKDLSDPIPDNTGSVRRTLKSTKFLGEDGKVYGMDEVRILPANSYR